MWPPPEPGDIVWCRFPQRPRDVPGPKPRPALVISVTEHQDGYAIMVAYGTSQMRIPPQYHHPFRSKPCQRFRTKPATRSTRNPTARSNPKSATHSKTNPPRRRVDVEGLRTSGRGQFPTALFAHRLAFEFQPMRSADQAIKDRVSYRRIAAAQIVMPAINR